MTIITSYSGSPSANIIISAGVTEIGEGAFADQLTEPSTLVFEQRSADDFIIMGDEAFRSCNGITGNLILPVIQHIGKKAFEGCSGFNGTLALPPSLVTLGSDTFALCDHFIGNINLPSGMTELGSGCFRWCSGFTGDITIPSGISAVADAVFYKCSGLSGSLYLHDDITSIGEYAFGDCLFAGTLTLPANLTALHQSAFIRCSHLSGVLSIPSSITSISSHAFELCTSFTGLNLSHNLEFIGISAFGGCNKLSGTLLLPPALQTIGERAFTDCSKLTGVLVIPDSVEFIGDYAFSDCGIESIVLNNHQTLGVNFFYNLENTDCCILNIGTDEDLNIQLPPGPLSGNINLPPGVVIDTANTIRGSPTQAGVYESFIIIFEDEYKLYNRFIVNVTAVCFLADCDVLVSGHLYKNITTLTLDDMPIGLFSRIPQKIAALTKCSVNIELIEETNKPYFIPQSSFGEGIPNKDIHLSGHHRIILKDDKGRSLGIQTFKLVNLQPSTTTRKIEDYYHIQLENKTEGLIVNNLSVEAFQKND